MPWSKAEEWFFFLLGILAIASCFLMRSENYEESVV